MLAQNGRNHCQWAGRLLLRHGLTQLIQGTLKSSGTFEIVDILSASAQTVVHMLCESISHRVSPAPERSRKIALNPNLCVQSKCKPLVLTFFPSSDTAIFTFLEEYLRRLEGPIAIQVWNRYLVLAKEIASNVHGYKRQVFPCLRYAISHSLTYCWCADTRLPSCFTVLSEKICQTSAIEERRTRKEMQDTLVKLVDTGILISGRSFEQTNWIRRSGKDSALIERASTPIPRSKSDPDP